MLLDEKTVLEIWLNPGLKLNHLSRNRALKNSTPGKNSQTVDKLKEMEEVGERMQCHFRFKKSDHFPENGANLFKSALNF